jgi:UDP-N-acetylmuramate--alanine ligase
MEFKDIKNIHFIGIGGIGMSSLAKIVQSMGCKISGSDIMKSENTFELKKIGTNITIGHHPNNIIQDIQLVVYSSAIPPDNVELKKARLLNIPTISRAKMLSLIFNKKKGIAISGSHGKTTTTAILSYIMKNAGYNITAMIGGKTLNTNSNAYIGNSEWMITEADESDCGFTELYPFITVTTNIDDDHLNFYKNNIENEKKAFLSFLNNTQENGYAIINADDPLTLPLSNKINGNVVKYSLKNGDIYARNIHLQKIGYIFDVYIKAKKLDTFTLNIPGKHNVSNALPAIFIAHSLNIDTKTIKDSLESFKGVKRRFTIIGKEKGITIIDDYAHHPKEIETTLNAASEINRSRIIALFQPHRYTRVKQLFDKFTTAFSKANKVFITDIYPAGEKATGINARTLGKAISTYKDCVYIKKDDGLINTMIKELKEGDMIITLGAGDIWEMGVELLRRLRQQ